METQKARFGLPMYYAAVGFYWLAMYAFVPTFSNFAISQGVTKEFAGVIAGSYGFVQMLLRIPLGIASDKIKKRKPFVTLGMILITASVLGMYFFPTGAGLLLFRGLSGAAAASWVTITVLYSSYFSPKEAAGAMGRISSVMYVGQIIGMLLCGVVAQAFGGKAPFLFAAAFGAAGIALSFFIVENAPESPPLKIRELLMVGLTPKLMSVSALAILYQIITFGTVQGFTPVFAKEIGAPPFAQGALVALFTFFVMCAALWSTSKRLRARYGERRLIVGGFAAVAVSVGLMPLFPTVPALLALVCVQGFAGGLFFPMLMGLGIEDVAPEKRGAAMGFYQSIYGLGMFIGPVLVGSLSESFDLSLSFVALAAIGAVSAALGFALTRKRP